MRAADAPLLTPGHFRAGQDLLDMTYVLEETPTMRAAAAAGASTVNGLGMLLHQGARSLEIWTGREAPLEVMRAALRQRIYGESS
jgi:shikimate dehydrogenase